MTQVIEVIRTGVVNGAYKVLWGRPAQHVVGSPGRGAGRRCGIGSQVRAFVMYSLGFREPVETQPQQSLPLVQLSAEP